MKLISRLFGHRESSADAAAAFDAPLAPGEALAVVGDVHGCDLLLGKLLDRIAESGPARLVFVGDYVDRGEASAAVLDRLYRLAAAPGSNAVFLRGNHEEMLLKFLDDPAATARSWLRYGGLQTLASFGIGGVSERVDEAQAVRARDTLASTLGPERLGWLRALPTRFVSGNVAVVHAGADPALPIEAQTDKTLVWGHPDFARGGREDGIWVVHGHTVTDRVEQRAGRIGVDTGAYATGRLSAALIGPGRFEPLSVDHRS